MRALRGALPAASCAERSARISANLLLVEPVAAASAAALFWPIGERREVDLRPFDALLRDRGVRVAYPSVAADGFPMTFRFVANPDTMEECTAHGVRLRQPGTREPQAAPGELDVIVVPALAVDPSGQRIGYGAGCYDRTLPQFAPPALSIAVAFDFQLIAEVPCVPGDVPVDFVVTDARTLRCKADGVDMNVQKKEDSDEP